MAYRTFVSNSFMRSFTFLLFALWVVLGCQQPSNSEKDAKLESENPSFAKGFRFLAGDGIRCVELLDLESDSIQAHCTICKGEPHDIGSEVIFIEKDETYATLSTTHLAYFWKLNTLEHVKGTAFASYVRNSEVNEKLSSGEIKDISGEKEVDTEALIALAPRALITYPYGDMNYDRIEALGIATIPFSEYLEEHPLGRAEWVKVVGFLTNEEEAANATFEQIRSAYESASNKIQNIPESERPVVFTGSHSNGMWYAPPGNSYISQFIQDAGGKYLFEDRRQKGNLSMQFETLFKAAMQADYWGKVIFDEGDLTLADLRADDERYAALPAFKEGKVFYCNAAETDYFGDAIIEPEMILKDLIAILHTDTLDYHFKYFKPIDPNSAE